MSRLIVHVEGVTEENFVNNVLAPHLYSVGYTTVSARLLGNARQRNRRGGIRRWESVRKDIVNHILQDSSVTVTTMVDYYGLPNTWPGRNQASRERAVGGKPAAVEDAILKDIADSLENIDPRRFVPYVVMHEFEGLLFSDPNGISRSVGDPSLSPEFQKIRRQFATPEEINDSPESHPARRITRLFRGYQKPLMGVSAAQDIGLDTIRRECPLFHRWVERLEFRIACGSR